jgi:hypothetical protein
VELDSAGTLTQYTTWPVVWDHNSCSHFRRDEEHPDTEEKATSYPLLD